MVQSRPLTIHVLSESNMGPLYIHWGRCSPRGVNAINVNERGVNARALGVYDMAAVTGIDFVVQAFLATQIITAQVIVDAIDIIESDELDTFAFICSHATHRSVGCAILLASLVYQNASIVFSTERTRGAARQRGMIEEDCWQDVRVPHQSVLPPGR